MITEKASFRVWTTKRAKKSVRTFWKIQCEMWKPMFQEKNCVSTVDDHVTWSDTCEKKDIDLLYLWWLKLLENVEIPSLVRQ